MHEKLNACLVQISVCLTPKSMPHTLLQSGVLLESNTAADDLHIKTLSTLKVPVTKTNSRGD